MVPPPADQALHLRTDSSGTLRVGSTRVAFESVVRGFQAGSTPEQIRDEYPSLNLADIYEAVAYYLRHRAAVDDYVHRQEAESLALEQRERREPIQTRLRHRFIAQFDR